MQVFLLLLDAKHRVQRNGFDAVFKTEIFCGNPYGIGWVMLL